jgi:putative tricarboxylic transport membrane protein
VTGDRALALAMLALAAGYYAMAAVIPESLLADAVGPQGLPKVYAIVLAALSLILLVSSGGRLRGTATDPAQQADATIDARLLWRIAGMLTIGVLYVALVPWLGYAISLAALIAATVYYQGGAFNRRAALVACSGAVFFWILFVWVLRIPQPAGVWPSFL